MNKIVIFAGIILYNPDIVRLRDNVNAIIPQVDKIVIVNNNSENKEEIYELLKEYNSIEIIENKKNEGIAYALNQLMNYAQQNLVKWMLTLDQDSVVPSDLISHYIEHVNNSDLGIITCRILDRNAGDMNIDYSLNMDNDFVDYCITSASLTNVQAVIDIGGFDNDLFIDSVDHDICIRLKKNGYRILRDNRISLLHEIGHSRMVDFLGKKSIVLNHSAFRHYYIVRNNILMMRKHGNVLKNLRILAKHIILTLVFENNKINKSHSMFRGLIQGCVHKI